MKKIYYVILTVLLLNFLPVQAQGFSVNPGIKLGYIFGEQGGFVFGVEMSFMHMFDQGPSAGIVLSADLLKGKQIYHIGIQGSYIAGIDIGPSFYVTKDECTLGLGTTIYTGFIIMPYFTINSFPDKPKQIQLGSYLKLPIYFGEPIRFAG
ncbi:MAG: hypothetical protein GXX85_05905 [Ignavibacteria bacterium]|nr:hypothetical protein [Ignavibacteria bacterium]